MKREPGKGFDRFSFPDSVESDVSVGTAGGEVFTVRREGQREDRAVGTFDLRKALTISGIKNPHFTGQPATSDL